MENPIKIHDLGVFTPIFGNTHMALTNVLQAATLGTSVQEYEEQVHQSSTLETSQPLRLQTLKSGSKQNIPMVCLPRWCFFC